MPRHDRRAVSERLDDCVFAGHSLTEPVPKYRFPRHEMDPKAAVQVVSDELILDGNARQNLATFCQTWAEPEMLALMALAVNKNMIDKDEYPQTAEIEKRCAHMLADLRARGWQVPAYALTAAASDIAVQRILVRLGVSRDIASLLLDDFRNAVDHFAKHPVTVSMSKEESGGFSHA